MNLYQNSGSEVALLDSEGRTHRIPNETPWEVPDINGTDCDGTQAYRPFVIPSNKAADVFIREGKRFGVVAIPQKRTQNGISFDVESAKTLSTHVRSEFEKGVIDGYIKGAKEDELAKLPVRPPSPALQALLDKRGLDLKRDFGITPVGYKVGEGAAARDAEMESLRQQLTELRELVALSLEDKKKSK